LITQVENKSISNNDFNVDESKKVLGIVLNKKKRIVSVLCHKNKIPRKKNDESKHLILLLQTSDFYSYITQVTLLYGFGAYYT